MSARKRYEMFGIVPKPVCVLQHVSAGFGESAMADITHGSELLSLGELMKGVKLVI